MKASQVKISAYFNKLLDEVVLDRKDKNDHIKTKQGIVEQLIEGVHKKEVKTGGE